MKTISRRHYRWVILGVVFVTFFLGTAIRNTASVFYPAIVEDFGWGRGSTAIIFSLSIIVYGSLAPLVGRLVDRFGPRVIPPIGAVIVAGGLFLSSLSTEPWQLYLWYGVLVAIGMSLMGWAPLSAVVSNWFSDRRGLVFAVMGAAFGGSMVSAYLAQYLISSYGWQTAYVIMGLAGAIIIAPLCALFLRHSPALTDHPLVYPPVTASPPLPFVEALPTEKPEGWGSGGVWTLARARRTRHYWLLILISFCLLGITEQAVITHLVYFFRDRGYSPIAAATIFSVFGVVYVASKFISSFSDRWGREIVFIPSCLLSAAVMALLFIMPDASRPGTAFLFAVLFGLMLGPAGPVFFATVSDLFHGRYLGYIQGFMILSFSLGGAIAPWLAGLLHDRTGSYFWTIVMIIAALVASAGMMWWLAPGRVSPVRR